VGGWVGERRREEEGEKRGRGLRWGEGGRKARHCGRKSVCCWSCTYFIPVKVISAPIVPMTIPGKIHLQNANPTLSEE